MHEIESLGKHKFRMPDFTKFANLNFMEALSAAQPTFYAFLIHSFSSLSLLQTLRLLKTSNLSCLHSLIIWLSVLTEDAEAI